MAINPGDLYPGKTAPPTADYPYGSARNVSTPGDGTGTPWEAALVNDLFGFQQAILEGASITPSGTPERVGQSQYLDALNRLFSAAGVTVVDVSGGANVILSEAQAARRVLVFEGELTANIAVIVPDRARDWIVINDTTGSFTLTLRTSGGTGFELQKNEYYGARSDGVNVIKYIGTAASRDADKIPFTDQANEFTELQEFTRSSASPGLRQKIDMGPNGSGDGVLYDAETRTSADSDKYMQRFTDRFGRLVHEVTVGGRINRKYSEAEFTFVYDNNLILDAGFDKGQGAMMLDQRDASRLFVNERTEVHSVFNPNVDGLNLLKSIGKSSVRDDDGLVVGLLARYSVTQPPRTFYGVEVYDVDDNSVFDQSFDYTSGLDLDDYHTTVNAAGGSAPALGAGAKYAYWRSGVDTSPGPVAGEINHYLFYPYMIPESRYPRPPDALRTSTGAGIAGTHEAYSDGDHLYVINHEHETIAKFDRNMIRVASITVGQRPHDITMAGGFLWVVTEEGKTLEKIDPSPLALVATYPINGNRAGFGIGTDGTDLWLGVGNDNAGEISAIVYFDVSLETQTELTTDVSAGAGNLPVIVEGGNIWSIDRPNGLVKQIDKDTGATLNTFDAGVDQLYGLGFSAEYKTVIANGFDGITTLSDLGTGYAVRRTVSYRLGAVGNSNVGTFRNIAVAGSGDSVIVYNMDTGEHIEHRVNRGGMKWIRHFYDDYMVVGNINLPSLKMAKLK